MKQSAQRCCEEGRDLLSGANLHLLKLTGNSPNPAQIPCVLKFKQLQISSKKKEVFLMIGLPLGIAVDLLSRFGILDL